MPHEIKSNGEGASVVKALKKYSTALPIVIGKI